MHAPLLDLGVNAMTLTAALDGANHRAIVSVRRISLVVWQTGAGPFVTIPRSRALAPGDGRVAALS